MKVSVLITTYNQEKYIEKARRPAMAITTDYYKKENKRFLKRRPKSSPYAYNKETLGFRLDSKQEIGVFRYGAEPVSQQIDDFFDYIKALVGTIMASQGNNHLHSDDWQRSVYIDTLGVSTTDFGLSDAKKDKLKASGRKGATNYFKWYDHKKSQPVNRP